MRNKLWPSIGDFSLADSLELSLRELCPDGKIKAAEAEQIDTMLFNQKKKMVGLVHDLNRLKPRGDARHGENYHYTYVNTEDGTKQMGGSSKRELIERLYDFYFKNEEKATLESVRKAYLEWFQVGRAPTTVDVDIKAFRKIAGTRLAQKPVANITYQDVRSFFLEFSKEHSGQYTKSEYDKIRTCIYDMLEYALDVDLIQTRIETFRYPKAVTVCFRQSDLNETWTREEHDKLVIYCNSKRGDVYADMFEYQLLTGDRYETVSALRPEDVDEENLTVFIHAHNVQNAVGSQESHRVIEGTKGNSSKGRRKIAVTELTMSVLQRAIEAMRPGAEFIFENENGKPVHPNTYRTHVRAICEEAGVPYHSPHKSRHYAASTTVTNDNIAESCLYYGWADPRMPLRYNRFIEGGDALRGRIDRIAPRQLSARMARRNEEIL